MQMFPRCRMDYHHERSMNDPLIAITITTASPLPPPPPIKVTVTVPHRSALLATDHLIESSFAPRRASPCLAGAASWSEPSRAEQSRAGPSRAEQSRAEQSRVELHRAEQSRAAPSPPRMLSPAMGCSGVLAVGCELAGAECIPLEPGACLACRRLPVRDFT